MAQRAELLEVSLNHGGVSHGGMLLDMRPMSVGALGCADALDMAARADDEVSRQ